MLTTQKILVQWCPTANLALHRRLSMGSKWSMEVQQDSITPSQHPELFPLAMALAESLADGGMLLQVGFQGPTRYDSGGWVFEGPPWGPSGHTPKKPNGDLWLPGEESIVRFDETPTRDVLLTQARQEWLERGAGTAEELDARVALIRRTCDQLAEQAAAGRKLAEEGRPPNPFFDAKAFYSISHRAPTGGTPRPDIDSVTDDDIKAAIVNLLGTYRCVDTDYMSVAIFGVKGDEAVEERITACVDALVETGVLLESEDGNWEVSPMAGDVIVGAGAGAGAGAGGAMGAAAALLTGGGDAE